MVAVGSFAVVTEEGEEVIPLTTESSQEEQEGEDDVVEVVEEEETFVIQVGMWPQELFNDLGTLEPNGECLKTDGGMTGWMDG